MKESVLIAILSVLGFVQTEVGKYCTTWVYTRGTEDDFIEIVFAKPVKANLAYLATCKHVREFTVFEHGNMFKEHSEDNVLLCQSASVDDIFNFISDCYCVNEEEG